MASSPAYAHSGAAWRQGCTLPTLGAAPTRVRCYTRHVAYDFLRIAERMIATPSVTGDGTAELVDFLGRAVVPHLPGEAVVLAEPDGRDVSLLVIVPGRETSPPLLLNSHLDTVPPGDRRTWTSTGGNPYRPRLDGDRLIGLGTADAKLDWLCKAEALRLHEETLRRREQALGPEHLDTIESRHNLALMYMGDGRLAEALRMLEETLRLREAKLGPEHRQTFSSRYDLALAYRDVGRIADAVRLGERDLAMREAKYGPDHAVTLSSRGGLAVTYLHAGRPADAVRLLDELDLGLFDRMLFLHDGKRKLRRGPEPQPAAGG